MYKIGPVKVAQKTYRAYKNINLQSPSGETDPALSRAFYQLRNSREDQAGRYDALEELGKRYENLKVEKVIFGKHACVKRALEMVATDENDELRAYASEIIGITLSKEVLVVIGFSIITGS